MEIVKLDAALNLWLDRLRSPDAGVHNAAAMAAAREVGRAGAAAIAPTADAMGSADKGVARAASQALQHLAHDSARPGAPAIEAQRVALELLKVALSGRPRLVRSEALNLLGFIGSDSIVPMLSRLLDDKEMREDARMALERIPGAQSQRALQQALARAPEDFRAALRHALFNRGLSRETAGTQLMK